MQAALMHNVRDCLRRTEDLLNLSRPGISHPSYMQKS